jgi:hypothetical protein
LSGEEGWRERETERERETDRQTETDWGGGRGESGEGGAIAMGTSTYVVDVHTGRTYFFC